MEEKEARIRRITHLYYSNPKVQEAILKFSLNREVVPRYFEGFGKRPDTLQYVSDIMGLVKKGTTSFHASEEIWEDPLKISSEMSANELSEVRKSWDLLIDIDSKYLDYSKIAVRLMLDTLERFGIKNYSVKFSGSKGFHIMVSGKAFPSEFEGVKRKDMFPEWPRAICEFLINYIRPEYNKVISKLEIDFDALKERTNLSKEDVSEVVCPKCGRLSKKGKVVSFECPDCKTTIKRKDVKLTKRKLECINDRCAGRFDVIKEEDYFYCEYCDVSSVNKRESGDDDLNKMVYSSAVKKEEKFSDEFVEGVSGNTLAGLDLVLVAPRHLFRMPYSLHEKTALASVVLLKNEIEKFTPPDADPLKIQIREFLPQNEFDEGKKLLMSALEWKEKNMTEEEIVEKKKYKSYDKNSKIEVSGVTEDMFPRPIKKLLKGLKDGRKRGLFILITFLRSLNFSADYINVNIRAWNALNDPPLKEGYVKSQIEWHLKQRKQILPPNYENDSFYKDLGLLDEKPKVKNPIVEVMRKARREG